MQNLNSGAMGLLDPVVGEVPPVDLQHGELLLQDYPEVLLVRERQHDGRPERLGREAPGLPDELSDVIRRRLRSGTNNQAADQRSEGTAQEAKLALAGRRWLPTQSGRRRRPMAPALATAATSSGPEMSGPSGACTMP